VSFFGWMPLLFFCSGMFVIQSTLTLLLRNTRDSANVLGLIIIRFPYVVEYGLNTSRYVIAYKIITILQSNKLHESVWWNQIISKFIKPNYIPWKRHQFLDCVPLRHYPPPVTMASSVSARRGVHTGHCSMHARAWASTERLLRPVKISTQTIVFFIIVKFIALYSIFLITTCFCFNEILLHFTN